MKQNLTDLLKKNKIICAPLCGYTDYAFRETIANFAPAIMFTEMLSVNGLVHNYLNTIKLYKPTNSNTALGIQLFGNDPEYFAKAVSIINDLDFDLIDINSGCSVKKILKTNAGCYLMTEPELIYKIIKTIKENTDKPVSIKMRIGFNSKNYIECSKAAEEAGAVMITLHGRTKSQMFSGKIDYEAIANLKNSVSIPVIGNGEIWAPEDAKYMLETTNCDAIMLARGLIGKPWLIKQCADYIASNNYVHLSIENKIEIILKHFDLLIADKGLITGVKEFRKHAVKYSRGIVGSKHFREKVVHLIDPDDVRKAITELLINNEVAV